MSMRLPKWPRKEHTLPSSYTFSPTTSRYTSSNIFCECFRNKIFLPGIHSALDGKKKITRHRLRHMGLRDLIYHESHTVLVAERDEAAYFTPDVTRRNVIFKLK